MATDFAVRTLNVDATLNNTFSVTGLSFQPKAVICIWNRVTTDNAEEFNADFIPGIGWAYDDGGATPYPQTCIIGFSEDNANRADTARYHLYDAGDATGTAACIGQIDDKARTDGYAELTAWNSDGVTFTTKEAFTNAIEVTVICLAGDATTNVAFGLETIPATDTTQDISPGFDADFFMAGSIGLTSDPPGGTNHWLTTFGAASGTAAADQWVISNMSVNNDDPTSTASYCRTGEVLAFGDSTLSGMEDRADVTALGSTITLNWTDTTGNSRRYVWLALAGGQYDVGNSTTSTSNSTDFSYSGGSFTPVGGIFMSASRAESTADTPTADNQWSMGAAESTSNQCAYGGVDEDNQATSTCGLGQDQDEVYLNYSAGLAVVTREGAAEFKSWNSDGYTLTQTNGDPNASFLGHILFGDAAGVGPTGPNPGSLLLLGVGRCCGLADNVVLNSGTGGATLATDDVGGVQYQRIKISFGADGSASDVTLANPLPITTVPLSSPQTTYATSVGLAAGGSDDLDSDQINSGLTGKLVSLILAATVPVRGDLKTVLNGVASSTLATVYRLAGDSSPWTLPSKEFITQAESATAGLDGFRLTVTNLDNQSAADVAVTFFYDEE